MERGYKDDYPCKQASIQIVRLEEQREGNSLLRPKQERSK